ncbi:MAG: hypothetical protein WCL00_00375 [Bacteroidota bacterium]
MKNYMMILIFLASSSWTFSQQGYQDVAYLKNGSVILGTIIEQIPIKSLKIETAEKNVLVNKMDEVDKMMKDPDPLSSSSLDDNSTTKPGYCGIVNIGYGFGIGESSKGINAINFDFINGFQLFPYFSVGLGTGVKVWFIKDATDKPIFIPAFVDLRAHFLKGGISPYVGVDLGYCWEVTPVAQGLGLLFSPTLGVSFKTGSMSRVNIGTGYYMQRVKVADDSFNSWNFNVGVSF